MNGLKNRKVKMRLKDIETEISTTIIDEWDTGLICELKKCGNFVFVPYEAIVLVKFSGNEEEIKNYSAVYREERGKKNQNLTAYKEDI